VCSTVGAWQQCVPAGGAECKCKSSWIGKNFSTECFDENVNGKCQSTRDCNTGTLSKCNARTPSAEVCDGIDNDCNGVIDDGTLCNDGLACTTDSCGGASGCINALQAGACKINFACYGAGDVNSTNPCQRCDPALNPLGWTTTTNACTIGGSCYPANTPNPILSCQVCDPSKSTTQWSLATDTCFIGGSCFNSGTTLVGNVCQACKPAINTTAWSANTGATCNDNNVCTEPDTCQSTGLCGGPVIMGPHEPNNTYSTAYFIGNMTSDDNDKRTITSKLAPQSDVDWFRTTVTDTSGHSIDPKLSVNSGGASVRACVYFQSIKYTEKITCKDGSAPDNTSSPGYSGCCKSGVNPTFSMDYSASLFGAGDDSFYTRIRIDDLKTLQCVDYSFDIKF